MNVEPTDCARLDATTVLLATPERAWLGDCEHPVSPNSRSDVATARKLLDGALGAAWRRAPHAPPPPPLTRTRWVWRLAGYYHLTHSTPGLMNEAAARFTARAEPVLAAWAHERAREEQGHDQLALRDIAALGHPAQAVVAALVPETAAILVAHFEACVRGEDPLASVGYAYTLERLALTVGAADIAAVQALLPPGLDATRCMRVHSAVGSDAAHVDDNLELVAGLAPAQRARIAAAVYRTAALCLQPPPGGHPDDAAITRALAGL